MSKQKGLEPAFFLGRLVMEEGVHPYDLDSLLIIQRLFAFSPAREFKELLSKFINAAMEEKYSWPERSPGELLFIADRLEMLIEACFLLQKTATRKQKKRMRVEDKVIEVNTLPIALSAAEYRNPWMVLEHFFAYRSLGSWKKSVHQLLEASLSNYSAVETESPEMLFGLSWQLEKLVEAAQRLSDM